jgi:plasmid replication initiation protein
MSELLTPSGYLANALVNGRYEYSAAEIDLFVKIVLHCRGKAGPVKIALNELADDEHGTRYDRLRENLRALQSKPLEFYNQETRVTWCGNLIAWSAIEKYTGVLTVHLAPLVQQMLTEIRSNYTTFQVEALLNLRGKYSKRLYLLACQFKSTGVRFFEADELRKQLGIFDVYPRLADFEKRVILPAVEEISASTDIIVSYEKSKTGRSVTGQCLTVKLKKAVATVTGDENQRRLLAKYGLAPWQILNVFQCLTFEEIARHLYAMQLRRDQIKNPGAYLVTMLQRLGVPMDKSRIPQQTNLIDQINEVTETRQ